MKILVLGAGGLGCFFGSHLQKINCDVTFLVREKRKNLLQNECIKVMSKFGNFQIKPKLILKNELKPIYNVILLTCKAYNLMEAISDLKSLENKGVIIPLLNGQKHIDILESKEK